MRRLACCAIVLGALVACRDTEPSSPRPVAAEVRVPATPPLPPPPATALVYEEAEAVYGTAASFHGGMLTSRFLLFPDSSFSLQYASARFGTFEYRGRYARSGDALRLGFAGWSTAGPWEATAMLAGDTLRVKYNQVMMMSDFVDGAYLRVR